MRRYIRSSVNKARQTTSVKITAAHNISERIFAPEHVAQILSQIPQLSDYNIGFLESPQGYLKLLIDDTLFDVEWA